MKIRLGVDVACRAAHQASCADEHGVMLWVGRRFGTDPDQLEALWAKLPEEATEVMVVMEPTRNAWVALAAWFRRRGATVVMIPPEQSADLRAYYNKHAKTDRLDSQMLARLPLLHPDGLHREDTLGPGDALKRAVKVRSQLVHRRTTSMARLDALLEILGPAWVAAIGSDMSLTALRFLARYGDPRKVKRLGAARLADFFRRSSRGAWNHERAAVVIEAAEATLRLWGVDGMDFDELAADIAVEARLALAVSEEIKLLDKRIAKAYEQTDPKGIVRSVPGVGKVGAPQITGRLGDATRFSQPRRGPLLRRAGAPPRQLRKGRPRRRADQGRRRLPARSAVHGSRPRPPDRPDHGGPLPPADHPGRQAPQLRAVYPGRCPADPYRSLPAHRPALSAARHRRHRHHGAARPPDHRRALHHPGHCARRPPPGHLHPRSTTERAGQERSRQALRGPARSRASMPLSWPPLNPP